MTDDQIPDADLLIARTIYENYFDSQSELDAYRTHLTEEGTFPDDWSWTDKLISSLAEDIRDLLHNGNDEDILGPDSDDELARRLHADFDYLRKICTLISIRLIAAGLTE